MKYNTILIVLMLMPLSGISRIGWNMKAASLTGTYTFQPNIGSMIGFSALYDRTYFGCAGGKDYWGLGASVNANRIGYSFHANVLYNPFKITHLPVNKDMRVLTHFLLSAGFTGNRNVAVSEAPVQALIRPGIGANGIIRLSGKHQLRLGISTMIEAFTLRPISFNRRLIFQGSVGYGLNLRRSNPHHIPF